MATSGLPSQPELATSDEAIRRRTGRGWQEWFDLLDRVRGLRAVGERHDGFAITV